jgi:XisH protein
MWNLSVILVIFVVSILSFYFQISHTMPRRDIFHEVVVASLVKEGWQVIDDPLRIVAGGVGLFIDITAEPIITFGRDDEKVAIEIKSFLIQSQITTFYEAIGKYITYRKALLMNKLDMDLYLAVPKKSYDTIFQKELVRELVKEYNVNIIVYNSTNQTIVSWIKQ